MLLRTILNCQRAAPLALFAAALAVVPVSAQERPAKRLSIIVGVAVEEYGKAIDANGRIIAAIEYDEAVMFLDDAKEVAGRLSGDRAELARAILDTLIIAVQTKALPKSLAAIHSRFNDALGADAALDLPTTPIDLLAGRAIYDRSCASCHGTTGLGDGPASPGMSPPPPALGTSDAMSGVTPALMYRIVSVGIAATPMAGFSTSLTPDERWNVVSYINTMRAPAAMLAQGEGLFAQRCAGCHGALGASDGALSTALTKLPAELSSFAWQAERSDEQIGGAIRSGIIATAMPASRDLTDTELASVIAHVRTLSLSDAAPSIAVAGSTGPEHFDSVARRVMATLDNALSAARAGKTADAGDLSFDAYIAFEPLETPARAKSPGLVASVERHFADFKGALKAQDVRGAERSRDAIEAAMPRIVELTKPAEGGWGSFLQSFVIILREGLEAILVIGAIVTFLIKTGHRERLRSIWIGVGLALGASAATAVILTTVLRALPATREIIEGVTMLIAVAVLFSVSYWLISKVEAAKWQQFIREKVNAALEGGGGRALTVVAFLAVYREGAETALFYQALFQEGASHALPISMGIVAGSVVLAVIFTLFHRYGVRIPLRPFFAVTSALLYFMAFVFMGKGIRELQEGNVVPVTVLPGFPHVEVLGLYPSLETLLAQTFMLVLFVFALAKTFWPKRSVTLPTVEPTPAGADARVEALTRRLAELEQKLISIEQAVRSEQGVAGAIPFRSGDGG